VSEILDRLEKSGHVKRRPNPLDRRRVECAPTAKAFELLVRTPALLQDRFSSELKKIADWERSFLLVTLQRIAAMMEVKDDEIEKMAVDATLGTAPIE
jgi:DNA-binding MarR family transcriptional regulator